jgi:hypothetical protein
MHALKIRCILNEKKESKSEIIHLLFQCIAFY